MFETRNCPNCGAVFAADASDGLCRECLLRRGLREPACLHVRCPHCHNPVELLDDSPIVDIECPSCGSHFSLICDDTATYVPSATKKLGHFELLERVGTGSFGTVWKSRDTRLDRIVALKIPRKEQLDAGETELFLREARSAARVRHPNIVSVHEVGREDNCVYIVSDYIEGASLADWLTGQRLTPRESAELCVKIAAALHEAHQAGIVHRDLKPGNIMLDLNGQPFLTDFGLAKRQAAEITVTVAGRILGTPAYMSPEQARGDAHNADRRSDVYSLGVILFELLTGELPFRGSSRMVIVQIQTEDAPSPRRLNSEIPLDLENICLKCLEKEPARRYSSAMELEEDLSRFLRNEPVNARPVTQVTRVWRWCRRNEVISALTAMLLLAIFVGMLGIVMFWRKAAVEAAEKSRMAKKALKAAENERTARLRADRQALLANAHRLVASSRAAMAEGLPQRATLLAIESFRLCDETGEDQPAEAVHILYDVYTKVLGVPLEQYPDLGQSPVFSKDGKWLVGMGADNVLRIVRLNEGRCDTQDLLESAKGSPKFTTDPMNRCLAALDQEGCAHFFELGSQAVVPAVPPVNGLNELEYLSFGRGSDRLLTVNRRGTLIIWDLASKKVLHSIALSDEFKSAFGATISQDDRWLVTIADGGKIRVWDLGKSDPAQSSQLFEPGTSLVYLQLDMEKLWFITRSHGSPFYAWDFQEILQNPAAPRPRFLLDPGWVIATAQAGHWLATASDYSSVAILWNLQDEDPAKSKRILAGHHGQIRTIVIAEGGQWLITGSDDCTGRVWNLRSEDPSSRSTLLLGHSNSIRCAAIDASGHWLATGSDDHTVRIWDLTEDEPSKTSKVLTGHDHPVTRMVMSPDGRWLITFAEQESARLWDLHGDVSSMYGLVSHGRGPAYAIDPSGTWLVTRNGDGAVQLTDLNLHEPFRSSVMLEDYNTGCFRFADIDELHRWLVTWSPGGSVFLWDLSKKVPLASSQMLTEEQGRVSDVRLSPNGRWLITGDEDGAANVWDLATSEPSTTRRSLRGHHERLVRVFVDSHGYWAATQDRESMRLWNLREDDPSRASLIISGVYPTHMDPKGHWLVTSGGKHGAAPILWDLSKADPTRRGMALANHNGEVTVTEISRDGRWLFTGGSDSVIRVWDLSAVAPTSSCRVLQGHSGSIRYIACEGSKVATAAADGIRLWDLEETNVPRAGLLLGDPPGFMSNLTIDASGRWLVASNGGIATVWDLTLADPAKSARVMGNHNDDLLNAVVAPNQRWVILLTQEGTTRLWHLDFDDLILRARIFAGRDLTDDERQVFTP